MIDLNSFLKSLPISGLGILGIFIVIFFIYLSTIVLNKLCNKDQ